MLEFVLRAEPVQYEMDTKREEIMRGFNMFTACISVTNIGTHCTAILYQNFCIQHLSHSGFVDVTQLDLFF